jgi:hypothetical protein
MRNLSEGRREKKAKSDGLKQIWVHLWPPLCLFSCPNRLLEERHKGKPPSKKKKKNKGKAHWESVLKKPFRQIFLQL